MTELFSGRSPETLDLLLRRRSSSAKAMGEPGPSAEEIQTILAAGIRVPDHGKLAPWRFVILEGPAKAAFAGGLDALAQARGDSTAASKLAKLKTPPLAIAVISAPRAAKIPEWEQVLSAGAVCTTLTYAAMAMGFGTNWITDWYAYDPEACALLGLAADEKVAGFILVGTPREPPLERERPDSTALTSHWAG